MILAPPRAEARGVFVEGLEIAPRALAPAALGRAAAAEAAIGPSIGNCDTIETGEP